MSDETIIVEAAALEAFAGEAFQVAGLDDEGAAYAARCLVEADLRGVESHGVLRLPIYIRRLQGGAVNPRPRPSIVNGAGALEVMDGDAGLGYLVGRAAMLRAVELAGEHGIAAVGVANSSHFGPAGIYARLAAERDMIGVAMSNVVAKVVAPGGSRPITGNNPLAVAVPSFGEFPFALDMSLSAAAGGKLLLAAKKGETDPARLGHRHRGAAHRRPRRGLRGLLPAARRRQGSRPLLCRRHPLRAAHRRPVRAADGEHVLERRAHAYRAHDDRRRRAQDHPS